MTRIIRKARTGVVISDKMQKTRTVLVERTFRHSLYMKVLRSRKRYYVHDETNLSKTGDRVEIVQTRPLSKMKRWRVVRIIGKI